MAFIESPRFPDTIALGAKGGPRFLTSIVAGFGGAENRNRQWVYSRGLWEIGQANRDDDQTKDLITFFYVTAGRLNGFRFRDPKPSEHTGTDEPIGTGDGSSHTWQLLKRYTWGSVTYDRPIYKPVSGTLIVKVAGVVTSPSAVDYTIGTFTITATGTITASYEFDVPCRFDTDELGLEYIEPGLYSWPSIKITEIQDLT